MSYLECITLISLELVGSGISGLFDWVFKVLKCQQFIIKERYGEAQGVLSFVLPGAVCYFSTSLQLTDLWFPSWLFRSEARKTLQKILYGCIDYFASYLQWNTLLTCILLHFFDSKMHQIWGNWGIYKLFLYNAWDKEVMLCITYTSPFWSLSTLFISFLHFPAATYFKFWFLWEFL